VISILEDMPGFAVLSIELLREVAVQALHPGCEVRVWRPD
jgi:hypothetical protein